MARRPRASLPSSATPPLLLLALALGLLVLGTGAAAAQAQQQREKDGGHRQLNGRRHGGERKRGRAGNDEAVVFDKSTIPYCNIPNNVEIPPLADGLVERTGPGLKLLQVQVVARHGSRTPYKVYNPTCWDGYGFTWNCNVTEMTQAGTTVDGDGRPAPWIFRKIYDGSPTALGGTCHLGQLVTEGFEQEVHNGEAMARAYIGPGPLKLFSNTHLGTVKAEHLYLRSDDDPSFRTEMSGEFLVRGMFASGCPVTLIWHTGDFELDDLYPNEKVCPALEDIEREAFASREWAQVEGSDWVRSLNRRMKEELPGYSWEHMLDCLGTTSCTDRPFPGTLSRKTFDDAMAYSSMMKAFPFHWNDAYFSKLAMGPLARTLLQNLQARAEGDSALRFALFLAHDTTVLPLLCAWDVWDGAWPSYAALLAIELYEAEGGRRHYVRLVYAGQELVLPGCTEALCPLEQLAALTEPWALAADDPRRPCWTTTTTTTGEQGEQEEQGRYSVVEDLDEDGDGDEVGVEEGRVLPASSSSSPLSSSSSSTAGAYIQSPSSTTGGNNNTTAPPSSVGGTLLALLLGAAVGAVLTLAWERRRQRGEYVGVGGVDGAAEEGGSSSNNNSSGGVHVPNPYGSAAIPHPVLSAVDRGRYVSI